MRLTRKIQKFFFERLIGKIFFQRHRESLKKMNPWARLIRRTNQFLNEKGCTPPWIYTKQECLNFWAQLDNKSSNTGNRPEKYAGKERGIIDFLHDFWRPEIRIEHRILELGCNAGGNLIWLHRLGYSHLSGIEINPHAIAEMRRAFPELVSNAEIMLGSGAAVLTKMPADSVDVIFTLGVAMHIHPSDNFIFAEMARVTRKYICTVEPETANSNYVFARNYERIFKNLGLTQLKSCLITPNAYPHVANPGLTARLFAKS